MNSTNRIEKPVVDEAKIIADARLMGKRPVFYTEKDSQSDQHHYNAFFHWKKLPDGRYVDYVNDDSIPYEDLSPELREQKLKRRNEELAEQQARDAYDALRISPDDQRISIAGELLDTASRCVPTHPRHFVDYSQDHLRDYQTQRKKLTNQALNLLVDVGYITIGDDNFVIDAKKNELLLRWRKMRLNRTSHTLDS